MIGSRTLYRAGALALLERLDTRAAALVYLDPPWFTRTRSWSVEEHRAKELQAELREYLSFISKVAQQCHRILSDQGSLYFLTDVWRSRDIQFVLDQSFGRENFRARFIWPRVQTVPGSDPMQHYAILLYTKTDNFVFNEPTRVPAADEIRATFPVEDEGGRPYRLVRLMTDVSRPDLQFEWRGHQPPPTASWRYSERRLEQFYRDDRIQFRELPAFPLLKVFMRANPAVPVGSVWDDIPSHICSGDRVTGYFGQNPKSLLDRIVRMGSIAGDLVVDPFCGSGTSIISCESLKRDWVACDSEQKAVEIAIGRLGNLGLEPREDFQVGDPVTLMTDESPFPFYYSPTFFPEDIEKKPLIVTEGKTDWKHMKVAFQRLQSQGYYEGFDIEFREYEEEIEMG